MLGCLLLVPAVLGAMRMVRVGAAWLGLIGGVLMIAAYICYFGMVFESLTTNAMARQGGPVANYVAVLDVVSKEPLTLWVAPLFIFGNIVGTFLLGLAPVQSHPYVDDIGDDEAPRSDEEGHAIPSRRARAVRARSGAFTCMPSRGERAV